MKKRLPFIALSFLLLMLFLGFSFFVHKNVFTQLDFDTTVRLQDNISRRFDYPFSLFSVIGSFEIATIFLLLLLAIFRKLKGIFVLFIFALFHVIEIYGKYFIDHPGPPFMFLRTDISLSFPSSYVHPGSAFPSGHSGRTIFISIVLGYLLYKTKLNKHIKYASFGLILLFDFVMLLSRVYLAEHWSSDVVGGALLGASFAIFSLIFI